MCVCGEGFKICVCGRGLRCVWGGGVWNGPIVCKLCVCLCVGGWGNLEVRDTL